MMEGRVREVQGEEGRTLMPLPLSWIWRSLRPPSLTVMRMLVAPASSAFSMSSLSALDGRWMICRGGKGE